MTDPIESVPDADAPEPAYHQQRSSIRRNTRHLLLSQGATWTLATVFTVVLPRIVGAEVVGQVSLAASFWAIAMVLIGFGLSNLITLDFARGQGTQAQLRAAVGLQLLVYAMSAVAIIVIALLAGYHGELLAIIVLAGIATPFSALIELARWTFFGLEQVAWPATVDVVNKVATVVLIVAVVVGGGRGVAITIANGALAMFGYVLMVGGLRRRHGFTLSPSLSGASSLARRAVPFLVVDAAVVVYRQSDTIMISVLSNETQVGWYSVAETFLGSLLLVPTLILSVVFPTMARRSTESTEEALRITRSCLHLLWLVCVPVGLGTVVMSDRITAILLGDGFAKTGPVLAWMGVVMMVMVPAIVTFQYGVVLGRQSHFAWIALVAFFVSLPLHIVIDTWTNRRYGSAALGAAIVFAVTEALMLVLSLIFMAPGVIDRSLVSVFVRANIAGALLLAAAWPLRDRMILLPIAAGAVVYIAAIFALRATSEEERRIAVNLVNRLRRS